MAQQQDLAKVEQYLVLIKSVKGAALQSIVQKALAEPGLFAFGELLSHPNVQALRGTPHEPALRTLELFAWGTWPQFKAAESSFLPLDSQSRRKLKQLTMCSLAKTGVLPYADLMASLDLDCTRELERFVIQDCVYPSLIKGKLDQVKRCVHVQDRFYRDVPPDQLPSLVTGLHTVLQSVHAAMAQLNDNVAMLGNAAREAEADKAAFQVKLEEKVEEMKKSVVNMAEQKRASEMQEGWPSAGLAGNMMGMYGGYAPAPTPPEPGRMHGNEAERPKRRR